MRKKGKGRGFATERHQLKYGGSRTRFSFRICRKYQGFRYFWRLEIWGEKKERKRFSLFLKIGEMMRKEGKEEDRQQGSLVASIGNIKGFAFFQREG